MDKIFYAVLTVAVVVGGVYFAYSMYQNQIQLEALAGLYKIVSGITTYEQSVETSLIVSDRHIVVRGTYLNDRSEERYTSFATTTLDIPGETPYSFSLSNIAIKDRVYVKLEKVSGDAVSAVPMGPEWHQFTKATIPDAYKNVAVPGPILDNLALFRGGAPSLTLLRSVKGDTTFGEPLTSFEYTMAPKKGDEPPSVQSIRDRLLGDGTVRIWTDETLTSIRYIVMHAPDYTSTTTISSVNIPHTISPPAGAR